MSDTTSFFTVPPINMPINNIPMSNNMSFTSLKLCSLNSRSLPKLSNPETSSSFIRYLRQLKCDILCFQEANASSEDIQTTLNVKLQAHSSYWTAHCGIVSLNSAITVHPALANIDDRGIICRITHINDSFDPFMLLNIYAPAQPRPRELFYASMLNLPMFQNVDPFESPVAPMLIVGDFNYHAVMYDGVTSAHDTNDYSTNVHRFTSSQYLWHNFVSTTFHNVMRIGLEDNDLPTFRRGSSATTIDYVYASSSFLPHLRSSSVDFVSSNWTDHALLSVHFQYLCSSQGPGLWRANPMLACNSYFTEALTKALDRFHEVDFSLFPNCTSQDRWDRLKSVVKDVARTIGRRKADWRRRTLARLQRKRNKILRTFKTTRVLHPRLPIIEQFIGMIQNEMSEIAALRAGRQWRENGETSAGYLKRTIEARAIKKNMPALIHPVSQSLCDSPETMQDAVTNFYTELYTPDPIDSSCVESLSHLILPEHQLPSSASHVLLQPFSVDDLIEGASRSPRKSSPGTDGLPYEILLLLFGHPLTATLAQSVYTDALLNGIFPKSWTSTCMTLLPKKGDLSNLRNWRPISLINTDAKVFTRLLNTRLMSHFSKCISPHQLGFMPGRFIADHGLTVNCVKMVAHQYRSSSIGLLLDQEKAYDRIHPGYLREIMSAFNVPDTLIHSITSLFFSTQIQVNVNGHLTQSPIPQLRGLRQGDPLSPLLFNIAFDPFVRSIAQNSAFSGFRFENEIPASFRQDTVVDDLASLFESTHITQSVDDLVVSFSRLLPFHDVPDFEEVTAIPCIDKISILAYADDTLVLLRDHSDFNLLQRAIDTYMKASNALLNFSKTEAFSLSGSSLPAWQTFLSSVGITSWHDRSSPSPLRYLGYPLCSSVTQRNVAFARIADSVRQSCFLHSQRQLSIRGRATVLNTLIYSQLWHVLRLSCFTKSQLTLLRGIGSSFVNHRIFPRFSSTLLQLPKSKGGVALMDPSIQQKALQWRWLYPLLMSPSSSVLDSVAMRSLRLVFGHFLSSSTFSSYRYYLLFPDARHSYWFQHRFPTAKYFLDITKNIVSALDILPRSFSLCTVNVGTCLSLPLLCLIDQSPSPQSSTVSFAPLPDLLTRHPGLRKLVASDLFTYDRRTLRIVLRDDTNRVNRYRNLCLLAASLISNGQLIVLPFFRAHMDNSPPFQPFSLVTYCTLQPFCSAVSTSNSSLSTSYSQESIRYYKTLLPRSPSSSPLSPSMWRRFWKMPMPLHARTVWFRAIHNKIPTRSVLQSIMPSVVETDICVVCSSITSAIESRSHFLWSCHLKLAVWRAIFNRFICTIAHLPSTAFIDNLNSIMFFSRPCLRSSSVEFPDLSVAQIFACTLLCIWRAHWNVVFSSRPFLPGAVISSVCKILSSLQAEFDLDDPYSVP